MRGPGIHVAPAQRPVERFEYAHHVRVAVHRTGRQLGAGVHGPLPGRCHQLRINLLTGERFLCHAAPGQLGQGADRGKHPLAARRCVQGGRLAEQRQERPNRVVPASQCRAHRRFRRAVIVGHELFNQIDRVDNDYPRRDSLHRRPQRSDIKPGAGVLGSGELVKQHPARAGDRLGGLLQPRQHRQPLLGRRAAGRSEQPGRHQQRQQVQRVIDRGGLQAGSRAAPAARDPRSGSLRPEPRTRGPRLSRAQRPPVAPAP